MTFELSHLTKILILAGAAIVVAAAGLFLLEFDKSSSPATTTPAAPAQSHAATASHHPAVPVHHHVAVVLTPGLPGPLQAALTHSKVVVAVVYMPGNPVDAQVLAQARAGAKKAHTKVVRLDVSKNGVALATATLMQNPFEPAVLVAARPGKIVYEFDGYADSTAVAQAVADAQR